MTGRLALPLLLTALAGPAAAQAPGQLRYEGSEVFRFALYQRPARLAPLTEAELPFFDANPSDLIVIVIGDTSSLPRPLTGPRLGTFVQNGGAVLIATDSASPVRDRFGEFGWGTSFGINVNGRHLTAGVPWDNYRGVPGRPYVRPRPAPGFGPDLFDKVPVGTPAGIATDHPSEMTVAQRPGFAVGNLAGYPEGTRRIDDGAPVPPERNYFAVSLHPRQGNVIGRGRALVLADHSVFVNGMMGFKENPQGGFEFDNGNWAFANRTIDWLQAGFPEPRKRCLFVEDGRVIDRFAVELPPAPKPPIPNIPPDVLANILLNHSNGVLNELQEKNFFNRMLEGWLGFPLILRLFLITVTVLFAFAGLRWLMRSYRRAEPAAVLTPAAQAGMLPRGGLVRQRTAALLEVGNLFEAARRRVRERFDVLGGRPGESGRMPPVLLANDLSDGPVLRQAIRWLWAVGYGESPVAVPPAEWDRLNGLLERATARAARGDWSFGAEVG